MIKCKKIKIITAVHVLLVLLTMLQFASCRSTSNGANQPTAEPPSSSGALITDVTPIPAPVPLTGPSPVPSTDPALQSQTPLPLPVPDPVGPPAPILCCSCAMEVKDALHTNICNGLFTKYNCTNFAIDVETPNNTFSMITGNFFAGLKAKNVQCDKIMAVRANHSWATSDEWDNVINAGNAMRASYNTGTTVISLGCGLMGNAGVTWAKLNWLCGKVAATDGSYTIIGNQTITTLDPAAQVPASFSVPRACAAITAIDPRVNVVSVMNSADGMRTCADLQGKGCFTPTDNTDIGQGQNTGSGGVVSCLDVNGKVVPSYCQLNPVPLVNRAKNVADLGAWEQDVTKITLPPCASYVGFSCYEEVYPDGTVAAGALRNACTWIDPKTNMPGSTWLGCQPSGKNDGFGTYCTFAGGFGAGQVAVCK